MDEYAEYEDIAHINALLEEFGIEDAPEVDDEADFG